MDVNALKLKTKNMAKKIENATKYIEEIDNHKKSILNFGNIVIKMKWLCCLRENRKK